MNHWGRTELAKILGLLALLALCTSGAEAAYDFSEAARITNEGTGVTSGPYYYIAPSTEYVTSDEVAALLERCLEYVRDGDKNYLSGSGVMDSYLFYAEPHRTLKDDAQSAVNEAKAEKDALDRETKLRRDIEAVLQKLRKGE